jgi:DNA-binding NtrC family response regulator
MVNFNNTHTILVVDDEIGPCQALQMMLKDKYNVVTCNNPLDAMEIVTTERIDIAILDFKMPKIDGVRLLKAIKTFAKDIEVILITGYPNLQSAVDAMYYGAYDYIVKPFDKDKIEYVVHKGIMRKNIGR